MSSSSMLPGGQERFAAARRVPTALSAYFQHHGVWAPGVRLFRSMRFRSKALLISLAWMTVVLSLGAMALLLIQIRRGAASRVSSLFFLVPPTAALMAWPMFSETLHGLEWAGMALVVLGVALVNLRRT